MAQSNTTLADKSTGSTFTALELNEFKDTVNSNADDAESRLATLESGEAGNAQGWAYYKDDGISQSITTADTKLLIDGAGSTTNKAYLPSGVTDLWDTTTNKVISTGVGDSYMMRIDLPITAAGNQASYMRFKLDIGAGVTPSVVIVERIISLPDASELPTTVSVAFSYFSLSTFDTNNAQIFLSTDNQTATVTNPAIMVQRISGAIL